MVIRQKWRAKKVEEFKVRSILLDREFSYVKGQVLLRRIPEGPI